MVAPRMPKSLVAEDLYSIPSYSPRVETRFYSLDRGMLCVREPSGAPHGIVGTELLWRLASYVHCVRLGVVVGADVGFVLQRNPDTVMCPDVAFISATQLPEVPLPDRFFEGAPDLAVEVFSPSNRGPAMERKVQLFLETGTRLVWMLHPKKRTATVYRPQTEAMVLYEDDTLDGLDVVPGFRVPVKELFTPYFTIHPLDDVK